MATMRVHSRFLSHLRLDESYSLLSGRSVSVVMEFFKALDIRGEMALDGTNINFIPTVNSIWRR